MIAILDTNSIINREIPMEGLKAAYITPSVDMELKDKQSIDYRQTYSFLITIRQPTEKYVKTVEDKIKGSLLFLSKTDIELVALTLEISEECNDQWIDISNIDSVETVRCFTRDNGMKNALSMFGLLNDPIFKEKKFKLRCYGCFKLFDTEVDFCNNCGYSTITRVTVIDTEEGEKVMLSKNYKPRAKELKFDGIPIISADQKEYKAYLKKNEKIAKNQLKSNFYE